jgi:hypothetical protein
MAGYIGSKAVLLSTTAAEVSGDADIGGSVLVDTIKADNGTTAMTIDSSGNVTAPVSIGNVGSIVQTVTHSWNTEFNYATLSDADITGSNFNFTPKFSNSKLVINYCVSLSFYDSNSAVNIGAMYYVRYGSTDIMKPTGNYQNYLQNSSNRATLQNLTVEISPSSTSEATIKLRGRAYDTDDVIRFNEQGKFYSTAQVYEIKV